VPACEVRVLVRPGRNQCRATAAALLAAKADIREELDRLKTHVASARALIDDGIESVGVATFDEALELRQAGIVVPIVILFPIPAELAPEALTRCLSITVGDRLLLTRTLAALDAMPAPADGETGRLAVHLEVETGLGRGGVHPEDVPAVAALIEANPRTRLVGLWSHLQAADDRNVTNGQDGRFGTAAALLEDAGMSLPARHIAASGGVLAATAGTYDVVRVGLAQYGIVPDGMAVADENAVAAAGLTPVMSLRARPVRVAWLDPGVGVSYGPSFVTTRRSRIATLPLGYADGYPRRLFDAGAEVLINEKRYPLAGNVTMDQLLVDCGDDEVKLGDVVVLLGRQGDEEITAEEWARRGDTITWEILCGVGARVPRVLVD